VSSQQLLAPLLLYKTRVHIGVAQSCTRLPAGAFPSSRLPACSTIRPPACPSACLLTLLRVPTRHPARFPARLPTCRLVIRAGEGPEARLPELQPGALPQLRSLVITANRPNLFGPESSRLVYTQPPATLPGSYQALLPASWGGLPHLSSLKLEDVDLMGHIPQALLQLGSFPSLTSL